MTEPETTMPTYRHHLPQLADSAFLTHGGIETTLIHDHGYDLPDFAAFPLLDDPAHACVTAVRS
jgi:homocysteine S-methyltransferase